MARQAFLNLNAEKFNAYNYAWIDRLNYSDQILREKWEKNLAGKGSKRRPTKEDKYRDNYNKIFSGNKNNKKKKDK